MHHNSANTENWIIADVFKWNGLHSYFQQKGNFVNVVRKAQAAAWEEKFMAMKAKQKEANKVRFSKKSSYRRFCLLFEHICMSSSV